jgi:hypothetical protein
MPMQNETWRLDIQDLRACAHDVLTNTSAQAMHARSVAQCLSGVVGLAARRFSLDVVQHACAELARHERSWETTLGDLPRGADGRVSEPIEMLAAAARGIYPLAGSRSVRSALAFWRASATRRCGCRWRNPTYAPQRRGSPFTRLDR